MFQHNMFSKLFLYMAEFILVHRKYEVSEKNIPIKHKANILLILTEGLYIITVDLIPM